jgi:RHS repeat-associated protein
MPVRSAASLLHFLFALLVTFVALTATAATATNLVPSTAPHGARALLVGSGLDAGDADVAFTAAGGNRASAMIVSRSATTLELIVPGTAASGPVQVTVNGAALAPLPFTLAPDPLYTRVATLAASDRAHDVFKHPSHVAVETSTGLVIVADTAHHRIVAVAPNGGVSVVAGNGRPGLTDGNGLNAEFNEPAGIAVDDARRRIYVADSGNHVIRIVTYDGTVAMLAGTGRPADDASGFKQPAGIAVDPNGNLIVADTGNSKIKLVTPAGAISTIAGGAHEGLADGALQAALFKQPEGVVVSRSGAIYVADTKNNVIRKIENGVVTTIAGTGHDGFVDGAALSSEFKQPSQLALDDAGNVWVADTQNAAIRVIKEIESSVSTLAGTGSGGSVDGPLSTARFKNPMGITFAGALYVGDSENDALRVIYPAIHVTAIHPHAGPLAGGNTVRVFGTGFVPGTTQIAFGTNVADSVTFVSSTELLVTAPAASAGTVDVTVTTPAGSSTFPNAYRYLAPPTIATIEPRKGKIAGGDAMTITGTDFAADGDTAVAIGGAPATNVVVNGPSSLTLTTPVASAGSVDVTVTTPGGSATLPAGFTYFAPPTITAFSPTSGRPGDAVAITGTNFDPEASGDGVLLGNAAATVSSAGATTVVVAVPQNAVSGPLVVTTAGGMATSSSSFTVVRYVKLAISPSPVVLNSNQTLQLTLTATLAAGGTADVTPQATWSSANALVAGVAAGLVHAAAPGATTVLATLDGLQATVPVTVTNPEPVPPDPSTVAPKLDPTIVGMFVDEIKFLYTGSNPIQTGVAVGAIDDDRAAVIRGTVRTLDGQPLAAVKISALAHPELGQTLSRADGVFDFAINGGGTTTLQFAKTNFIGAQRSVTTRWGQQKTIDDVAIIGYDAQVTEITLGAAAGQVARGSLVNDASGTRRATLLVPTGTTALLALPNGSTQAAPVLHVRATEYSIGPNGPKAMPAELPPASAYTYCVELSSDEAQAAGATEVRFSRPLPLYVENFLGFGPGTVVPVGYYDRQRATWVPSDNGLVLKILSVTAGLADLDLNGNGAPATPAALASAGIDSAERQMLATLYSVGQTLWRVPVAHFSSWDCNFPSAPQQVAPGDAVYPNQPQPYWIPAPTTQDSGGEVCHASVVNCYSGTLSESIRIVGTPYSLEYESSRVATTQNAMTVSLSGATVPQSLKRIDLSISIAGRSQTLSFAPQTNLKYDFFWNGVDVFGRRVQGAREAGVTLSYVYETVYAVPVPTGRAFGEWSFRSTGVRGRTEVPYTQSFSVRLGHFGAESAGFGTWSLSAQHFYDGRAGVILDAGSSQRSADPNQSGQLAVQTAAGNTNFGYGGDGGQATAATLDAAQYIAVGPEGALYITDSYGSGGYHRIRRVDPKSGIIDTIAGNGQAGFTADGLPAAGRAINALQVAVGGDGVVYFTDGVRVRRIVDGLLATVAGNGTPSSNNPPNGSVAIQVPMTARALAVGRDGTVYVGLDQSIARITADGLIMIMARIPLLGGGGLAAGPNGEVYATDNYAVYKIGPGGVTVIAGEECCSTSDPFVQDGQLGTAGRLSYPQQVAVAADGTVLVAETNKPPRIRAIAPSGIITTLIGTGRFPDYGAPHEGQYARATDVAPWGVAVAPDGNVYFVNQNLSIIQKAAGVFPRIQRGATVVPAPDGTVAYVFENGRHTSTVDTLTGTTLLTFGYDENGLLIRLTDADGNVMGIERFSDGSPSAIVAPGGQRTTLDVTAGHLTRVANPAGEAITLDYDAAGLLSQFQDARGGLHRFTYDAKGLVARDDAPDGSSLVLSRSGLGQNYTVTRTTAEGRTHTYKVGLAGDASASREHAAPDGTAVKMTLKGAATTTQASDGSVLTTTDIPDPRFGMAAPLTGTATMAAGGLHTSVALTRSATGSTTNPFGVASLTETLSVNGKVWTSTYDGTTRIVTTTTPAGRITTSVLDANGRISSIARPGRATISFGYGEFGLLASTTQSGRVTSFGYDEKHRLSVITDALQRRTSLGYDDAGRVIAQMFPDGRAVTLGYDANGNVTSVTPPSRSQHLFTFTPADLTASYGSPSSSAMRYTYNGDRQVISISRPDGSSILSRYDTFGRLSSIAIARGTYTFDYDPATDQLRSSVAPGGVGLAFGYAGPLLTSVVWSGPVVGAVGFSYDANLRLASEAVVGGSSVAYNYDADGLLIASGLLSLQRDQNGFLSGTSLGTASDAVTYNEFGEVVTYTSSAAGAAIYSEAMIRDAYGRLSRKTETVAGRSHTFDYFYDTAGHLTNAIRDEVTTTSYRYDLNGNRQSLLINGGGVATGMYDDEDRQVTYGDAAYTYTPAGDLATKRDSWGTTTYIYDEVENLTKVILPGGSSIEYVIDGQNRRVGRRVNGTFAQGFLYASQVRVVAVLDSNGGLLSQFVYGTRPTVPDYMVKAGVTYRIISDHLGSPRLVFDATTGSVVQEMEYDEFGNVVFDTNPGFQPFGFAGGLYDSATRLVRFGMRDYDPQTGRWTTKDPVGFVSGDPNVYAYAFGDPINVRDSSGLSGRVTIYSSGGSGSSATIVDGHSWIVYTQDGGETHSYGTYGPFVSAPRGLNEDWEISHWGDYGVRTDALVTRSTWIDDAHEQGLYQVVEKYRKRGETAWTPDDPCSGFAAEAWQAATGEELPDKNSNEQSNPTSLRESIRTKNSGLGARVVRFKPPVTE